MIAFYWALLLKYAPCHHGHTEGQDSNTWPFGKHAQNIYKLKQVENIFKIKKLKNYTIKNPEKPRNSYLLLKFFKVYFIVKGNQIP